MAVRVENGKVILCPLGDHQLRRLSDIQFSRRQPLSEAEKARARNAGVPTRKTEYFAQSEQVKMSTELAHSDPPHEALSSYLQQVTA